MKIAVLSGKGGAGKTLVSVNLAASARESTYIDCDVEEPNGRLFFKPEHVTETPVHTLLPQFNAQKCAGCRKCVDFCRFNALVYIKKVPMIFSEVCHSCGGCVLVCPQQAISETKRLVGCIEQGQHGNVRVITGILNLGEASGVPVINAALKAGTSLPGPAIIDCPPGSACSVMESISDADYCLLVAEPTAFGFHNFQMVYRLVTLLKKPCGVVINKMDEAYEPLEQFCTEHRIPVLLRIPYSQELAQQSAHGKIISETDPVFSSMFVTLWKKLGGVCK